MRFPRLVFADSIDEAVDGADAIMVLTEWPEYRSLDPVALRGQVSTAVVIDGRNCLDPEAWRDSGWRYRALGRPRQVELAFAP